MYKKCFILFFLMIIKEQCALDDMSSAPIVHYEFDNIGVGPYHFRYETSDGTKREEDGEVHYLNTDDEAKIVTGSFSFVSENGVVYTVKYKADDQGFHPEGDHIMVPPFVPWIHHRHHHDHGDQHDSIIQKSTPNYDSGERILDSNITTARPTPTFQYLPSVSTESINHKPTPPSLNIFGRTEIAYPDTVKPNPEIILYSQTPTSVPSISKKSRKRLANKQ